MKPYISVVSKKESCFSMSYVSGRHSRSYNVAGGSPYLPDEEHTMYRRAHSYRQSASSAQKRRFWSVVSSTKNAACLIIGICL